jgi:hypothetical protein
MIGRPRVPAWIAALLLVVLFGSCASSSSADTGRVCDGDAKLNKVGASLPRLEAGSEFRVSACDVIDVDGDTIVSVDLARKGSDDTALEILVDPTPSAALLAELDGAATQTPAARPYLFIASTKSRFRFALGGDLYTVVVFAPDNTTPDSPAGQEALRLIDSIEQAP